MRRVLKGVLGLLVIAAAALAWLLTASLPRLDGELQLEALESSVTVARDALGVPTVRGSSRLDVARATGFLHAQDRFFQMDLLRRDAAGEIAALVGPAALAHDERRRLHRLREVARRSTVRAPAAEQALLAAYAQGVNAGLDALVARPVEYLVLGSRPEPWREEDTVLVILAMFLQLDDEEASRESLLARLHQALPLPLFDFLARAGTEWDAPIVGGLAAEPPIPGPEACDLRGRPSLVRALSRVMGQPEPQAHETAVGSNGWAIAGRLAGGGGALLANDMHLGMRVPNVWYRLRLVVDDPSGGVTDVVGATLPGTPAVVVGSNRHVAWGFTNSYGDWVDLVALELDPDDPERYRTADGYRRFDHHEEVIAVSGGEDRQLRVRSTIWGPVLDTPHTAAPRAVRWLGHLPDAVDLGLMEMEQVRDVGEAVRVAQRAGVPPQNFMAADRHGDIAWTIMGRIPRRAGYDPRLPSSWADGTSGWKGWLPLSEYPVILRPSHGRIWTANARVVDGEALVRIGDGGYAIGARAKQIRDSLAPLVAATEEDMLRIQLDDRALFLKPWRALLTATLSTAGAGLGPQLIEVRRMVESWDGRATPEAVGYRLVRAFRSAVHRAVISTVAAGCGELPADLVLVRMPQVERAVWRLVGERPAHLLAPGYATWDALLLAAARAAVSGCGDLAVARCTWWAQNGAPIAHPLSRAVPALAALLDMPERAVPGGTWVPRVHAIGSGASERLAVIPGREESGYFHMPGGQSGHPLSRFYGAGHDAWVEGRPLPFLPGPPRHHLLLAPAG
jgi:penicillin amidase